MSFGFSDGTTDHSVGGRSDDNEGTSASRRDHASTIIRLLGTSGLAAVVGNLDSFDADGFTIDYTVIASVRYFTYIALADLDDVAVGYFTANTAGSQSVTGTGVDEGDAIIFANTWHAANPPTNATNLVFGLGMATASDEEMALGFYSAHGAGTSNTVRQQVSDRCIICFPAAVYRTAAFTSFDSPDGFTVAWSGTFDPGAIRIGYLLLKKAGSFYVGNETQETSATTKSKTGVGFKPAGLLDAGFNYTASANPEDHNRLSIGTATADGEYSIWSGDTDNLGTTSTDRYRSKTKAVTHIDTDGPAAVDAETDLSSFDSDGYTLDWTTADAVARQFAFMCFKLARRIFIMSD